MEKEVIDKIAKYVVSPEYINNSLYPALEVVARAKEQEKVDAAIQLTAGAAIAQGDVDWQLYEFTAAFLRDATTLELAALFAIPRNGEMFGGQDPRTNLSVDAIDKRFEAVAGHLDCDNADKSLLVEAAVGRLASIALCVTQKGTRGRLSPIERTSLGDSVVEALRS